MKAVESLPLSRQLQITGGCVLNGNIVRLSVLNADTGEVGQYVLAPARPEMKIQAEETVEATAPTPFQPLEDEVAACRRYYEKATAPGAGNQVILAPGTDPKAIARAIAEQASVGQRS